MKRETYTLILCSQDLDELDRVKDEIKAITRPETIRALIREHDENNKK
jgi:hypothetical protein